MPGDTLSAQSEVIGLKENSNGKTGTVYVRTTGFNQQGDSGALSYVRWVMVRKRDEEAPSPAAQVPGSAKVGLPARISAPAVPIARHGCGTMRLRARPTASAIIRTARASTMATA